MRDERLVLYGAYPLTSLNATTFNASGIGSHAVEIQRIANARSAGSTVVDKELLEKSPAIGVAFYSDDYRSMVDVYEDFLVALEQYPRYLRVTRTWTPITNLTTDSGWTLSDDASNKSFSYTDRFLSIGGIKFDILASGSANDKATITNQELDGVDLDAYRERGHIELSIKLPDVTYISSVTIKVGSDSSNYLGYTFVKQYDNYAFKEGWNYLSVLWANMTEQGVVDASILGKYVEISVNYSSSQGNATGVVLGDLIWQLEDDTRNFLVYPNGVDDSNTDDSGTFKEVIFNVLVHKGLAQSTTDITYINGSYSGINNDIPVTFLGDFMPLPIFTFKFSSVTNLSSLILTNNSTGDVITVTPTWAVNDTLVVDLEEQKVTKNNVSIDYSNVLPRFRLGTNRINVSLTSTSENTTAKQETQDNYLKGEL